MNAIEILMEYSEAGNSEFVAKLVPGIEKERFLGVRTPTLRKLARECLKDEVWTADFFDAMPHYYVDEYQLHAFMIAYLKDYARYLAEIERFLPYIDSWLVCDIYSPKSIKGHKDDLIKHVCEWIKDERPYAKRYGIGILMTNYLDEDYRPEYLELVAAVDSDEYYVKMMIAWFFATSLAKQWDTTVPFIEGKRLAQWTHNKTIQKACESFRVTDEHKEYLRTLRRK